jgi:3D (Asp-Asp-Asp) domain-containing protein
MLNFNEEQKQLVYDYLETITTQYGAAIGDLDSVETGVRYSIPHFYQTDSRWSSISYGSSTIGIAGCGPTSFAMVATGMNPKNLRVLDTNGDKIISPPEAAKYSESHGYKGSDGTGWGFFQDAGSKIGLTVTQYSVSQYSQVLADLKNGYPVISSQGPGLFTRSGHFIVLVGFDSNGKIIVNDPASQARSSKTWSKEEIVASALQFWSFKKPLGAGGTYNLTAYTGDPSENGGGVGYLSANGTNMWKLNVTNRVIAVDPKDIKLGQKVYIQFPNSARYIKLQNGTTFDLNGVYKAVDTGGDIKGNRIDLYVGYDGGSSNRFWYNMALSIGRVNVKVYKEY